MCSSDLDEDTIHVKADKYWQGNSQSDFLLIAAKERKDGKLSKVISLIFVPRKYITYDVLNSEGLKAVRYAGFLFTKIVNNCRCFPKMIKIFL